MGKIFAILAALCNSTIGIFSNNLYNLKVDSINIAFLRCLIAFLMLSILLFNREIRKEIFSVNKKDISKYAGLAFLGIFIMYSFEVIALKLINVSLVSFLLYSSGIITIILGCIFLNEKFNINKLLAIILVFLGMSIMFIFNSTVEGNILGLFSALTAGIGYALFLFFMKKYNIKSGIKTLFYLFLFGSIYLSLPLIFYSGINIPLEGVPYIIALSIVPTIGGFYFTNKALSLIEAGKVQLFEMTEPFFATILAYMILGQVITKYDLFSGVLIMIGLLALEWKDIRNSIR